MTTLRTLLAFLAVCALASSAVGQTASPAGAKVYIINLKDGARVKSSFLVQFGLTNMGVAPAGVDKPNTGHHHLLIDTTLTAEQMKGAIPADDTHKQQGRPRPWLLCRGASTRCSLCLPIGRISHLHQQ